MKTVVWQIIFVVILILYAVNWSLIEDTNGDEKIYVISSAYLDRDININVEHPPLVKKFYNLLLTPEYKQQIYSDDSLHTELLWIPNTYATDAQHRIILNGTHYIRLINGFLITAFLLYCWWRSKDFTLFLSLFAILMVSNQLFSALLDGWLFVGAVGGYFLLKYGNPVGWVLAIAVAPLTKFYGFMLTPFSIIDHSKNAKQFAFAITSFAAVIILGWGLLSIAYGLTHFWMQFSGNNAINYPEWPGSRAFFNLRYITPFIGLLLVKYREKKE